MSGALSITRVGPDGTITVTLAADISSKDWLTAADAIRVAFPGRYVHFDVDDEGHDVFVIAASAPAEVAPLPCGLCAAGQPHSRFGHRPADEAAHQEVEAELAAESDGDVNR
ncbi:MAG TPA: hypothetical protein VIL68_02520 [Propionibacteriaceae bacterium]